MFKHLRFDTPENAALSLRELAELVRSGQVRFHSGMVRHDGALLVTLGPAALARQPFKPTVPPPPGRPLAVCDGCGGSGTVRGPRGGGRACLPCRGTGRI